MEVFTGEIKKRSIRQKLGNHITEITMKKARGRRFFGMVNWGDARNIASSPLGGEENKASPPRLGKTPTFRTVGATQPEKTPISTYAREKLRCNCIYDRQGRESSQAKQEKETTEKKKPRGKKLKNT